MSGRLYQLKGRSEIFKGSNVAVNGPYDTYGYVIKSEKQEKDGEITYLHLVRGTGEDLLDACAVIHQLRG